MGIAVTGSYEDDLKIYGIAYFMSIEKEINQQHFVSEYQKASINLIFTSNWVNERIKTLLDNFDVTSQQFNILRILRGAGEPLSTLKIRQRMLDKMSDTSRIVDRLIKKGLARKMICKTDKRLVDVTISEKGTRLLEQLDAYQSSMDAILNNLTNDEAGTLNHLLDKIRTGNQTMLP